MMKANKWVALLSRRLFSLLFPLLLLLTAACAPVSEPVSATGGAPVSVPGGAPAGGITEPPQTQQPSGAGEPSGTHGDGDAGVRRIRVIGSDGEEAWNFSEKELMDALENLSALPAGIPGKFNHVYSTVNNWPTGRFYAAEGYSVASILTAAGLFETAQTITFRADDGYEVSLTREQLLAPQYFYPYVNENGDGAEIVYPIIAYRWREGSSDPGGVRDDDPCLIIGQRDPFEHTNPAFTENVSEIVVSAEPCGKWPLASTFPMPGPIAAGETVKLQHPYYGLVKLHYTLDGSEPTMLSKKYNPSTYQPELNVPIPITEPTVIKVLVCGYGKSDSEIAVFEFTPLG